LLTTGQLDRLDEELDRYKNIDNKIFLRRQEIIYNKKFTEHSSGSNKISNPTENTIIRLESDIVLRNLELFKEIVELLLEKLTPEQITLFNMHWLGEQLTWEEISERLDRPVRRVKKQRRAIIETYANMINL